MELLHVDTIYTIPQTGLNVRSVPLFHGQILIPLQWRHNERDSVSNHQLHDCLLNRWIWHRSKKTSKLRVTGLCAGNPPVTGEFPAQRASNAEYVSIWWRHHEVGTFVMTRMMNANESQSGVHGMTVNTSDTGAFNSLAPGRFEQNFR